VDVIFSKDKEKKTILLQQMLIPFDQSAFEKKKKEILNLMEKTYLISSSPSSDEIIPPSFSPPLLSHSKPKLKKVQIEKRRFKYSDYFIISESDQIKISTNSQPATCVYFFI
jgi:hypothetical protein